MHEVIFGNVPICRVTDDNLISLIQTKFFSSLFDCKVPDYAFQAVLKYYLDQIKINNFKSIC